MLTCLLVWWMIGFGSCIAVLGGSMLVEEDNDCGEDGLEMLLGSLVAACLGPVIAIIGVIFFWDTYRKETNAWIRKEVNALFERRRIKREERNG